MDNLSLPQVIFGFGSAFANSFILFTVMRFGTGVGSAGVLLVRFVYSMEVSTVNLRTTLGTIINFFFTVGGIMLAGIAFWLINWRNLMLTAALLCIPPLFFWK